MVLSNEGCLSLRSRHGRWAHDTTAVVHGKVQASAAHPSFWEGWGLGTCSGVMVVGAN